MNDLKISFLLILVVFPFLSYAQCPDSNGSNLAGGSFTITDDCVITAADPISSSSIVITESGSLTINVTGVSFTQFGSSIIIQGDGTAPDGELIINSGSFSINFGATVTVEAGALLSIEENLFLGTVGATSTLNINGTVNIGNTMTAGPYGVLTGNGSLNITNTATNNGTDDTGFTGSVNCDGGPCSTLPVELSSFTGTIMGDNILLKWTTLTETNNDGFEIEKSTNGKTFETIGYVSGGGTINHKQDYSFIDYELASPAMYRLKQYDYDGTVEYSHIILVQSYLSPEVSIYPTYVDNTLNFVGPDQEEFTMKLVDISGHSYISTNVPAKLDDIKKQIDNQLDRLLPSIYIIQLTSSRNSQTLRFIKR
ncbi:hypothetical protein N6H18_09120 [Reichenbachiella agarivorans]|uniref:Por secretion system C-terminal sorting domain-containing protein n=1 Tax=Reichenbachiella agarivorans TaxID=2979464 RepID=A0ABY6CXC6_9BACT|nr:hypothetical protein [Reichenbachiella agarivorans]UXP34103.1 hypothetical protein N6H18_09120 [Reichenbachiella agarivorans]